MSDNRRILGEEGENFAAAILEADGYTILDRNYRCKEGEIDIIAEKNNNICFVEVKTRRSLMYGNPAEAVTAEKKHHIRKAAMEYLNNQGNKKGHISFHVIEIIYNRIEDAF